MYNKERNKVKKGLVVVLSGICFLSSGFKRDLLSYWDKQANGDEWDVL
jgi:hypothetical protein